VKDFQRETGKQIGGGILLELPAGVHSSADKNSQARRMTEKKIDRNRQNTGKKLQYSSVSAGLFNSCSYAFFNFLMIQSV